MVYINKECFLYTLIQKVTQKHIFSIEGVYFHEDAMAILTFLDEIWLSHRPNKKTMIIIILQIE
jgi:hypothetical protein